MSNIEAELKLRLADPSCLNNLLTAPCLNELSTQPPYKQTLETTYYDTADQRLLKSRLSYRLRLADGKWTATVKADGTSDGGLHQRFEYNVPLARELPSIEPFLNTDIGERLAATVGNMSLEPVFSTRFDRHIMDIITPDGSNIELALDDGDILAGDKRQKILELELELKAGQPEALIWLGAVLAEQFPLLPEQDSKLYRATLLAGLADSLAQDTPLPAPLTRASTILPAHQVLSQTMIYTIHEIIRAQQTFFEKPDDNGTLQDFRTVLAKLNALLQFAKPLIPAEEYVNWQEKLSAWDSRLGNIHDFDSFSLAWDELTKYMTQTIPNYAAKPVLTALMTDKRTKQKTDFYTAIATGELTPVLLGLWSYLQSWSNSNTMDNQLVFRRFAYPRFSHWLAQLLEQGNTLDLSDPDNSQQLRVTACRLGAALVALAPALPDSTEVLIRRLNQLTDLLGEIKELMFTPALLRELVKASSSRLTHRDAGLITGWQLAKSAAAQAKWDKVWAKVTKAISKQKKLKPEDERC